MSETARTPRCGCGEAERCDACYRDRGPLPPSAPDYERAWRVLAGDPNLDSNTVAACKRLRDAEVAR